MSGDQRVFVICCVDVQREPLAPRPQSASFLRAHSHSGYLPQSARPASVEPQPDKVSMPKATTARDVTIGCIRINVHVYIVQLFVLFALWLSVLDDVI